MTQSNNDSGSDLLVGLNHVTVNYADIQKVLEVNRIVLPDDYYDL